MGRSGEARVGVKELAVTLGIETSCDETSVALVEGGRRVLANVIHSQVDLHKEFGGVVPELAARDHLERLPHLLDLAFEQAQASPEDVGLIAVTRGPGLAGFYAAMLARADLEPPLLGLVVSGAHSDLVRMPEHGRFEVIGRTRDDAAGEAFDKAARMLGLGYPGGPALDRLARTGDARRQPLPRPSLPGLEFSFSGLKTALLYRLRDLGDGAGPQEKADLAAAFERSVVESLLEKLDEALSRAPVAEVVVAGGVAANTLLRRRAAEVVGDRARLTMPPLELCTDNAAMIAAAAYFTSLPRGEVGPARSAGPGGGPQQSITVDPSVGWD